MLQQEHTNMYCNEVNLYLATGEFEVEGTCNLRSNESRVSAPLIC